MRSGSLFLMSVGLLSLNSSLWAGVTQCSDATSSVQYYLSTPDGGAPRPPIEYWTIAGQTYSPVGCDAESGITCTGEPSQTVSAELLRERQLWQKQHGRPGAGDARFERVYTVRAKVSILDGQKLLTDSFLICRQSYYNGLPRP